MKIVESFRSLLTTLLPSSYDETRPHHILLGFGIWNVLNSTGVIKKISNSILRFSSSITESFIPLVQLGLVPDFLIRFGIRVQLVRNFSKIPYLLSWCICQFDNPLNAQGCKTVACAAAKTLTKKKHVTFSSHSSIILSVCLSSSSCSCCFFCFGSGTKIIARPLGAAFVG